jgi:hypothetical protein
LYGYETLPVTLREEHILRVLENRVLRGIFRPECEEVAGGWRKLHDEIHNLCPALNISKRRMRWARCVACMGN